MGFRAGLLTFSLPLPGWLLPATDQGKAWALGGEAGPTEFMVVFLAFDFNIKMRQRIPPAMESTYLSARKGPPVLLRCEFVQQRLRGPAERAQCPLTAATRTEASGCHVLGREARVGGKGVGSIGRRGVFLLLFFVGFFFFFLVFFTFYDFFCCCCFLLYREVIAVIPLIETDRT